MGIAVPWWVPVIGAGLLATGIFWAGDHYGWNARQYAKCKTVTARRNTAIASVNRSEEAKHAEEAHLREAARVAFRQCPGVQSCLLTPETAACLNTLRGTP
jgi:hypothetical protein